MSPRLPRNLLKFGGIQVALAALHLFWRARLLVGLLFSLVLRSNRLSSIILHTFAPLTEFSRLFREDFHIFSLTFWWFDLSRQTHHIFALDLEEFDPLPLKLSKDLSFLPQLYVNQTRAALPGYSDIHFGSLNLHNFLISSRYQSHFYLRTLLMTAFHHSCASTNSPALSNDSGFWC